MSPLSVRVIAQNGTHTARAKTTTAAQSRAWVMGGWLLVGHGLLT
jgi:hypothetical protein